MAQYIEGDLPTKLVKDGSVPFAVIIPIKRQMNEKIPLILNLHGGGGSREGLKEEIPSYNQGWADNTIPKCIVARISGKNKFYSNLNDGTEQWRTFLTDEFIPFIEKKFNCGGSQKYRYGCGVSMGGHGTLKLAFHDPTLFAAIAAMEPGIDAAIHPSEINERNYLNGRNLSSTMIETKSMLGGRGQVCLHASND